MNNEQRLQQIRDAARYKYPDERIHFIDGAHWADSHPQWIPVEERLPEHNEEKNGLISYPTVLVCCYDGYRTEDYYDDIRGEWGDYDGEVEYWMPMPVPPQRKEE